MYDRNLYITIFGRSQKFAMYSICRNEKICGLTNITKISNNMLCLYTQTTKHMEQDCFKK